jgi:hypothetical protein
LVTRKWRLQSPTPEDSVSWYTTLNIAYSYYSQTGLTQPSPEHLRKEFVPPRRYPTKFRRIRRCRQMTSKPFGVNITLLPAITPPDYVGYAKVIVEEGINIVETAGNNPRPVIEVFRNAPYKIYILHKYLPLMRCCIANLILGVHRSDMLYPHRSSGSIFYRLMDSSVLGILAKTMCLV